MRSTSARLYDILDCIQKIQRNRPRTFEEFESDELTQAGLIKFIELIGEAANHLPVELRNRHERIAWRQIIGMRHRTVHGYFDIDLAIVWRVVTVEVDRLEPEIQSVLAALDEA